MRVGIPRALLYYTHYPFWAQLLRGLGAEVVLSGVTTQKSLERGLKTAEDETCLPVKVAFGHLENLRDRVDYLLLPVHVSLEPGRYMCPKIIGLTDMVRHSLSDLPPILRPMVNLHESEEELRAGLWPLAEALGANRAKLAVALAAAQAAQAEFRRLVEDGWWPDQALRRLEGRPAEPPVAGRWQVGVVGHSYLSADGHTSQNLLRRLGEMGVGTVVSDAVPPAVIDAETRHLPKDLFWTLGRRLLGAGLHFAKRADLSGVIYLTAFSCGSDSMVEPFIQGAAQAAGRPFLSLTVDEHTAEAGLITRLEAFVDMVERRRGA